nr:unnamed protein product [Spirometra erinaceieuropaei]
MDGELELLRETFPDALSVQDLGHGHSISLVINPAVETNNVQVSVQLNIFCPVTYPSEAPTFSLRNALGLSDIDVEQLHNLLVSIIEASRGDLVLFPLIECCREFVASNTPSIDCAICFEAFQQEEDVYRSPCDHFFHKKCISTYHTNLADEYSHELAEILSKNPHCPPDIRPELKFPCPLCKTNLQQFVLL